MKKNLAISQDISICYKWNKYINISCILMACFNKEVTSGWALYIFTPGNLQVTQHSFFLINCLLSWPLLMEASWRISWTKWYWTVLIRKTPWIMEENISLTSALDGLVIERVREGQAGWVLCSGMHPHPRNFNVEIWFDWRFLGFVRNQREAYPWNWGSRKSKSLK